MSIDKLMAEQTEILRSISGEMKGLNTRVDRTNVGLEQLKAEVSATNDRLDATNAQIDVNNVRLERVDRGITDLGTFMRGIARDQARHEQLETGDAP